MNFICPSASRISCLSSRSLARTGLDSLVGALSQRCLHTSLRPLSILRTNWSSNTNGELRHLAAWRSTQTGTWPIRGVRTKTSPPKPIRIITSFNDLPQDFDCGKNREEGLPFRRTPLTEAEAKAIFGDLLDARGGNNILRYIHWRRVSGTLGMQMPHLDKYHEIASIKALEWSRKNVPVDEAENEALRIEAELRDAEADILADSERLGLWKPNSGEQTDVFGESVLDKVRKENERKFAAEEERRKEQELTQAQEIQQRPGDLEAVGAQRSVELQRERENTWFKYFEERSKVLPDTPPEISPYQRLWPSALLVLGVVGASLLLAEFYTPPKKSIRMWSEIPPSAATILGLILLNCLVFAAWRMPPLWRVLNKYFIVVPGYPRPASLIGSVFSQQGFAHLAANMILLWVFGTRLHEDIGRGKFLAIYMSSGVIGAFVSTSNWVFKNTLITSSLGASGAICGIIGAYFLQNAFEPFQFFGLPPKDFPIVTGLVLFIASVYLDLRGSRIVGANVDHVCHLAGYATGAASAGLLWVKARQKRKMLKERRKNIPIEERIKESKP